MAGVVQALRAMSGLSPAARPSAGSSASPSGDDDLTVRVVVTLCIATS
jgi:hypothetical protein